MTELTFFFLIIFSVSSAPDEDYVSKALVFLIVLYALSCRWVHFSGAVLFYQPHRQLFTCSLVTSQRLEFTRACRWRVCWPVAGAKPYKCPKCERHFVSSSTLKVHLKSHSNKRDYRCSVCQASFNTNGSLTRHMVTHTVPRHSKCPMCPESFRSMLLCKRHIRQRHPKDAATVIEGAGQLRPLEQQSLDCNAVCEKNRKKEKLRKNTHSSCQGLR